MEVEISKLKETIRCMSEFLTDCATDLGTPAGDVEAMGDAILKLKEDRQRLLEALVTVLPRAYNEQIPDHVHKRMSPDMFADVEMARAAIAKAKAA